MIRRWVADSLAAPTQLELQSHLRATNTSGTGTTVHLYQNGTLLDTLTTNSGAGLTNSVYPTINPGDVIDLALTPEGMDGDRADGSDGSAFRLTVTDNPPPIPPLARFVRRLVDHRYAGRKELDQRLLQPDGRRGWDLSD